MPNWSTNYLVATGEGDALSAYEAWIDAVLEGEPEPEGDDIVEVSLAETVLPVPGELWYPHGVGKTSEELDDLEARYGSRNAHEWRCDNWGTKWADTEHQVVPNFVAHDRAKPRVPHLDLTARPSHTLRYTTPWTIGEGVVAAVSALHPDLDFVGFALQEEGFRVALTYRAGQKVDDRADECNPYELAMVGDTAGTVGEQLRWAVEEHIAYLDFTRSFHDIATEAVTATLDMYLTGVCGPEKAAALAGPWSDTHLDALSTTYDMFDPTTDLTAYETYLQALLTCVLRSANVPLDVLGELHTPTGRFVTLQPARVDSYTWQAVNEFIAGRSDWQEAFKAAYDALTADEKFTYDQMRPDFDGGPFTLLRVVRRLVAAKG